MRRAVIYRKRRHPLECRSLSGRSLSGRMQTCLDRFLVRPVRPIFDEEAVPALFQVIILAVSAD
jgi:hypothetical protein